MVKDIDVTRNDTTKEHIYEANEKSVRRQELRKEKLY